MKHIPAPVASICRVMKKAGDHVWSMLVDEDGATRWLHDIS